MTTVKQLFMNLLKEMEQGNGDAIIYICDIEYEMNSPCVLTEVGTLENVELDNGDKLAKGYPLYV